MITSFWKNEINRIFLFNFCRYPIGCVRFCTLRAIWCASTRPSIQSFTVSATIISAEQLSRGSPDSDGAFNRWSPPFPTQIYQEQRPNTRNRLRLRRNISSFHSVRIFISNLHQYLKETEWVVFNMTVLWYIMIAIQLKITFLRRKMCSEQIRFYQFLDSIINFFLVW